METEDIVIFRRQRGSTGQWMCREKTLLKVEFNEGRFVIFERLAKQLSCRHNDAVMFAFSKKDKCAYVFKEDPEEDSYYLRQAGPGRPYFRFTSKQLADYFHDLFECEGSDKVGYFEAAEKPNDKGWIKLTLKF